MVDSQWLMYIYVYTYDIEIHIRLHSLPILWTHVTDYSVKCALGNGNPKSTL